VVDETDQVEDSVEMAAYVKNTVTPKLIATSGDYIREVNIQHPTGEAVH